MSAFWILKCSASLFNNFWSTNYRKVSFGHCVGHMTFSHDIQFSLVAQSCPTLCEGPHELQHARPPCPSSIPGVHPNSCPLSRWCRPAISSSVVPFSSCPNPSQHQGLFQWVSSSHEVAKVLEFHAYCCFILNTFIWLCWVLTAVLGVSLVAGSGAYCLVWASHCSGFSCCRAPLGLWGFSGFGLWALEHRLSSWDARA